MRGFSATPPGGGKAARDPDVQGSGGSGGHGVRGRLSLRQGEAPPSRTDAWVLGSGGEGTRAGTVSGV